MADFVTWLRTEDRADVDGYRALQSWSVRDLTGFWGAIADYFDVQFDTNPTAVLTERTMPGTSWFPGARTNFAQHLLRQDGDGPALVAVSEDGRSQEIGREQLRDDVAAFAAHLRSCGVGLGDRVVACLPNTPEAVVGFLATASIGALWAICGPEFGTSSVIARFAPLEPTVLIATSRHRFGGKDHDRTDAVDELRRGLASLRDTVIVEAQNGAAPIGTTSWSEAIAARPDSRPNFESVPFDHPLWILFSSGTTGVPKGIVQSHGGILLEHLKYLGLHVDLTPHDRFFWYTSTSWMMWNMVVSSLLTGSSALLYDGSPVHPGPDRLWHIAEDHKVTIFGTSAAYLHGSMKADLHPARDHDLSALRAVHSAGSPLSADAIPWAADRIGADVPVVNGSGGTDVASGIVGGNPLSPVVPGEISGACLGVDVQAWDDSGSRVVGKVGELVIVSPMPSMPIYFWNDPDGARMHSAYFDTYPGTWRHGDWIEFTERGTAILHGRSDATLNRMGVRMGTSEIYQAVESLPEIKESLVTGVEGNDNEYWLPLFVVLMPGAELDDALRARIVEVIRREASPRHVPDDIIEVPAIPHTLTGKKLEIPVKRILQGHPGAVDRAAVDSPGLLDLFRELGAARRRVVD